MTSIGFSGADGLVAPVTDFSGVHGAVAAAVGAATRLDLAVRAVAAVSLVATELGSNLARHAHDGVMIVNSVAGPNPAVQLIALDEGPGIADPAAACIDGFSTKGSLGGGLGACQRLSDDFALHSEMGQGTIAVVRSSDRIPHNPLRVGGPVTAHPDEELPVTAGSSTQFPAC